MKMYRNLRAKLTRVMEDNDHLREVNIQLKSENLGLRQQVRRLEDQVANMRAHGG